MPKKKIKDFDAIVIGGSAGSFGPICKILSNLPLDFELPIILCLHRLKNISHGFAETLSNISPREVLEPFDKDPLLKKSIYLSSANYHLYIEKDLTFALSTDELINFSRPSIDLMFDSAALCFKNKMVGIILSGANRDGVFGMKTIFEKGGLTIAQCPEEAQVEMMPKSAIDLGVIKKVMTTDEIIDFLKSI